MGRAVLVIKIINWQTCIYYKMCNALLHMNFVSTVDLLKGAWERDNLCIFANIKLQRKPETISSDASLLHSNANSSTTYI